MKLFYPIVLLFVMVVPLLSGYSHSFASGTGEFLISNYGSGTQTGNYFYRGYVFRVSQETVVTHLVGGGNSGNFIIGLYTSTMNGAKVRPTELLGFVTATGNTAEQVMQLESAITLVPNQDYVLAQGRSSGSGSHYYVNNLNVQNLLDGSPRISFWEPSTNNSIRWNGDGSQTFIVNQDHLDYNGAMPRVGFYYLTDTVLPMVTTGDVSISSDNVIINGSIDEIGGGDTTMYIEIGTQSNLSDGTLYNKGDAEEDATNFSHTFTPITGTLYYYRAVGINEAGRTNGAIESFRVYSVTYGAGANGEVQGATSQRVFAGGSTTEVIAVPTTAGYVFEKWSDNNTDNPRSHINVSNNISLTASFIIPPTYTLQYSVTEGGSLSGNTDQVVEPGADGTNVTATANIGYYFAGWSDGVETLSRTDVDSNTSINVTARFALITNISNIETSSGETNIDILWSTNSSNSSRVNYGLTSSLLRQTSEINTDPRVKNHTVSLTGLAPCSRYYYKVISEDLYNTVTESSTHTFLTNGCDVSGLTGEGNEENMDPSVGGVVEYFSSNAKARLNIPDGYAAESASFQINKLDKNSLVSSPAGKSLLGDSIFNLVAKNELTSEQLTSFDQTITFSVFYDQAIVEGIDVDTVDIYRYNPDTEEWHPLSCQHNSTEKTFSCQLNSFSIYGAFGLELIESQTTKTKSASPGITIQGRIMNLIAIGNLRAAIDLLNQYIKLLRSDNVTTVAAEVPRSIKLVRDLEYGMEGDDVTALQKLLITQGYNIPAGATGYFGKQTQYALDAYQVANGVAPRGGYFGPITRGQMKAAGLEEYWW